MKTLNPPMSTEDFSRIITWLFHERRQGRLSYEDFDSAVDYWVAVSMGRKP